MKPWTWWPSEDPFNSYVMCIVHCDGAVSCFPCIGPNVGTGTILRDMLEENDSERIIHDPAGPERRFSCLENVFKVPNKNHNPLFVCRGENNWELYRHETGSNYKKDPDRTETPDEQKAMIKEFLDSRHA